MRAAVLFSMWFVACVEPGPGVPAPVDAGNHASAALNACASVRGRVTTITAATERLNALPPPVTPACFVASLSRPIDLVATTSIFSAQPAASRESPRIFVMVPALVTSVVPEGEGAHLLEFAQWMTPTRTLKAEVELPLLSPLSAEAPYTRVHSNHGVTSCGLCHRAEEPHPTIDGGFISDAFRPDPASLVPVSELRAQHAACVDGDESERCALFHALFDFGEVRQGAFSNEVDLFIK